MIMLAQQEFQQILIDDKIVREGFLSGNYKSILISVTEFFGVSMVRFQLTKLSYFVFKYYN